MLLGDFVFLRRQRPYLGAGQVLPPGFTRHRDACGCPLTAN
jgi:hypothetical protein